MKATTSILISVMTALGAAVFSANAAPEPLRRIVSLDGTWQIAEGKMEHPPAAFDRTVPVPGLVDMAEPPFIAPGPKVANRGAFPQKDPRRDAFWYRRTFRVDGAIPAVARLKIGKAMFGVRALLNGQVLGDHPPSFTPALFDVTAALKTGENELVVRVGADRDAVDRRCPNGFDFEKERYIPGIFDAVELILTGAPYIGNVQVAPDIAGQQAKVRVYFDDSKEGGVEVEIREAKSGQAVGRAAARKDAATRELDLVVPIKGCRLWSPEDPFLYTVVVRTGGDQFTTRFGMREFRFDPATRRALLNGKPYFMRGSNITLYRFFEDPDRGRLPWDADWVRKLHRRVKDMHWNCLRYCIGFPPEVWYEIADEEGILIQDEFPIWCNNADFSGVQAEELVREYGEWMRERWNHPCLAVWDACNETFSEKTDLAIKQVRKLDMSNRPWDNGYRPQQEPGDTNEQHPYHYGNPNFKLANLAIADRRPQGSLTRNDGSHAVIVNEYGYLWVNRDGTPTTLTAQLYNNLLGADATPAQRFHTQATYTAADTEFWRAYRQAAAVMHFTTLGYSRPDGQTSDHWTKDGVASLQWEPEFYRYVRDAFAPVGLMIEYWKDGPRAGGTARVPVVLINDLANAWSGPVTLRVRAGERVLFEKKQDARVEPFGTANIAFELAWPEQTGPAVLEAELCGADGQPVRSTRDVSVKPPGANLAEGRPATASSVHASEEHSENAPVLAPNYRPENAVDDEDGTYWSSAVQDDAWLAVDLGVAKKISRVNIVWETAYAQAFSVQISGDGKAWVDVHKTDSGKGGATEIKFGPAEARHVRVVCTKRGTQWGNAIRELEVY